MLAAVAGCENGAHNMYEQPKDKPLTATTLWPDGRASREIEPGTVVHSSGTLAGSSSGRLGVVNALTQPDYSAAALRRGQSRFEIYCSPCHGLTGDGNGYVTRRGFPHPPSYHTDRLRAVADSYLFDVISNGYGAMYAYRGQLSADDRWAVVEYVRALQLAEHSSVTDLTAAERARLEHSR